MIKIKANHNVFKYEFMLSVSSKIHQNKQKILLLKILIKPINFIFAIVINCQLISSVLIIISQSLTQQLLTVKEICLNLITSEGFEPLFI